MRRISAFVAAAAAIGIWMPAGAQQRPAPAAQRPAAEPAESLRPAPNRRPDEGKGPYNTLAVRAATLIDGTGGPPRGPVDIVVSGNKITAIRGAGTPGLPLRANRRPQAAYELDPAGLY